MSFSPLSTQHTILHFWGDKIIQSAEGVQQGNPLGPLLFCLGTHQMCTQLESEVSLFCLDNGTLGGNVDDLMHDLNVVEWEGAEIGLQLNGEKSEIVCAHPDTVNSILPSLQGAQVVEPSMASLLDIIGDVLSMSDVLRSKTNMLKKMGDRLKKLSAHDAILLLKRSFALPKLLYNLRTSPCFSPLFYTGSSNQL